MMQINFRKFGYDPRVVKDISANIDWGLSKEPNCRVYLTITQSHYYEHTLTGETVKNETLFVKKLKYVYKEKQTSILEYKE